MNTGTYDTTPEPIPAHTPIPTRNEQAVEMYLHEIRVQDICVELGIHPPTLYFILRREGVLIDRRGAHPMETSQDATRPFVSPEPRAIGRPSALITEELRDLIVKDYASFGSARKVARLNGLTYWFVLRTLRDAGVALRVGAKRGAHFPIVDLAGRVLAPEEVTRIQQVVEASQASPASLAPPLEDIALKCGVSLGVLTSIIVLGEGVVALQLRREKRRAARGTSSVGVAEDIDRITAALEIRIRREVEANLGVQPPLFV